MSDSELIPGETRISWGWAWVEAAARMLGRDEREAVLGDLIEAGDGTWQALLAVLGLVLRREVALWRIGRPWIAAFGLSLPFSFLLMGTSLALCHALQGIIASSHGLVGNAPSLWIFAIGQALLLVGWSWTGGFVASFISRRTLWVSTLCCLLPCLFCLIRFRVESLSAYCLFVFLLPAVRGASDGLRITRIKRTPALLLAAAVTLLAVVALHVRGEPWWKPPRTVIAMTLTWPAWYLAVISAKTRQKPDTPKLARCNGEEATR